MYIRCNQAPNQNQDHFHHAPKFLCFFSQSTPFPAVTNFYPHRLVLSILECHINGTMQYLLYISSFYHVIKKYKITKCVCAQ